MFYGRTPEITAVARALSAAYYADPVTHILLTGERGIGKTSLLNYCERMARDDIPGERTDFDFLVVSVSLADLSDIFEITQRVADRLRGALDEKGAGNAGIRQIVDFLLNWEILGVHYHRPTGSVSGDQALSTLVDKFQEVERTGLFQGQFITIDEADAPPASAGLGTWCKDFSERLKRAEVHKTVLALAGQANLPDRLFESHKASLRLFDEVSLPVLSVDERREILRRGMRKAAAVMDDPIEMTPDAEDRLADLSEGYPYFLQTYAQKAFDAASGGQIDLECVEFSASRATEAIGRKFFDGIYSIAATSDNYRAVLRGMSRFGSNWMTRQEIVQAVDGVVLPDNVANALRKMKHTDALDAHPNRPGLYRLPTKAFAAWLSTLGDDD